MTELSENTNLTIPLKNILGMIAFTAIATMAYFSIEARLTTLEHNIDMTNVEIKSNSEFRILWPRGQLGSLPADARQDMLIEGLERDVIELREMQDRVHELTIRIGTVEALYRNIEILKARTEYGSNGCHRGSLAYRGGIRDSGDCACEDALRHRTDQREDQSVV